MKGMDQKIALNDVHEQLGAKMMPFAGFIMPVRYSSELEEHRTVRKGVGVFDVSHMGEFLIKGPKALNLIQWVSSNDASVLSVGQAQYSYLPNDTGGIIDDLLVYRMDDEEYMLVVNASNIQKDWDWINLQNTMGAIVENISDQTALFAVQGPEAVEVLQKLTSVKLDEISSYRFVRGEFAGVDNVILSATGYTGAGGFELYINNQDALTVWNALFEAGKEEGIRPIGLGARDTLRLEMGFPLYGNELKDDTSPIEAGLGWITKFNKDFINKEQLKQQKENGIERKLIGFILREKGIPRAGYPIFNADGDIIGEVTSGTLSPSMGIGLGLGYVKTAYAKPGTHLAISVRKKSLAAVVEKFPLLKK